ncbi:glycoside hydrolase family 65 protein [Prolixibacteraceae bacterium JC049]|nr:glycoside hydrolase family 65 protein [Prolixibacteraceae bacterium JC049]
MKNYLIHDEWKVIEEGFVPELNRITESVCSLGNGRMGQRANFEEKYSGDTLQGSYVAGVYYPDKTRVGWWKNGYPEYFAKVLNACNWIGINVTVNGVELDLATAKVIDFRREMNMQHGILTREFTAELTNGNVVKVKSERFMSMAKAEAGAIRYSVEAVNFDGEIEFTPYLDADIKNEDANYDEKFWTEVVRAVGNTEGYIVAETRKTLFHVATGMKFKAFLGADELELAPTMNEREKYVDNQFKVTVKSGETVTIEKYAVNLSSQFYTKETILEEAQKVLAEAVAEGFDALREAHVNHWLAKWEESDIRIEGDVAAQQGIRFNIFHLNQTYTGKDAHLNIGPKGFTGEKYGGSTYWDTEAYCLPFYLSTANEEVARNLLVYRHNQLDRAIENAEKLGFSDGAALYPMVTMNGEECHNEWEITFEEIHRNGAIAFGIYDYIRYTGDKDYLAPLGFEVLLGISRFWSQRVNFSNAKKQYVMLGVTGPNEYENNVNNNWHTSTMAVWTLKYTLEAMNFLKEKHAATFEEVKKKCNFDEEAETARWNDIIENMYLSEDKELGVFLQQDGFLDKEILPVAELDPKHLPINQNWSWDRILRSCYVKQADVLQSMFWFEDDYSREQLERNFNFYEPITVHESSLSPCVHSILAASLGKEEKAYEMYVRTARLDLDDYNNDTEDGCHITSMAGTWMSVVYGFGGLRVKEGKLHLKPFIPSQWSAYSFKMVFRGAQLKINVTQEGVTIENHSDKQIEIVLDGENTVLAANASVTK